jgi:tripartite-type tricarboxylate transporter receptor subunit TctC
MKQSHNSRRHILSMAAGSAAALALPFSARAQAYPSSPIRIIVGFPPGGGADAFARLFAPYLSEKLGQPIAVENKTGANGNVATEFVSKAKPDGYTLLLSTSSAVVAAPNAFPNMPAHPLRDLTAISMAVESEFILITNPSLEAKTYKSFVALAQKSPGKFIHASPGIGSVNHIAAELLSLRDGMKLNTVHYRGTGPIITDLLANQVNMTMTSMSVAEQYIKTGRAGALLVLGKNRLPQIPDVPTSAELGINDVDRITFWLSLHGPKGMPKPIVDKIYEALVATFQVTALRDKVIATGNRPVASTPAAFTARIESDIKLYGEIFKAANIKIEQ